MGRPKKEEHEKANKQKILMGYRQDIDLLKSLIKKARLENKEFKTDTEVVVYTMNKIWG